MNKKCDVCGHDDLPINVYASSIGPVSFAYCFICSEVYAEPKNALETFVGDIVSESINLKDTKYYDEKTDQYRNYLTKDVYDLKLTSGRKFNTRSEASEWFKKEGF